MEYYQRLKPVPNAIPSHNLGFNYFAFCSSWQDATYLSNYRMFRISYIETVRGGGIYCYILAKCGKQCVLTVSWR